MIDRFLLHIVDGRRLVSDGLEVGYDELEDAREEAYRVISELVNEGVWARDSHGETFIKIVDGFGVVREKIYLWQALERAVRDLRPNRA